MVHATGPQVRNELLARFMPTSSPSNGVSTTKERTTLMQDPVQIEKLLRARDRILAFIDLDQRALERTPGIQALELSLTSRRRQLVSIDSKFTALTGLSPQQYQAES